MGLFSRKESGSSRRQTLRPRPSVSSEAQAATLRVKARRRLTGAVALVLAVVVILPILLDGEPKPISSGVEITIPSKNSPYEPLNAPVADATMGDAVVADSTQSDPAVSTSSTSATTDGDAKVPVSPSTEQAQTSAASEPAIKEEKVAAKPSQPAKAAPTPAPAATNEPDRTDDGSRALALLAGNAPSEAQPSGTQLVVQIASYSNEADARSRQDKLKGEGVSNAFVEESLIDGKTMYRLRVGPFGSREAAQAAQTRLRTLGYSNGFIATQ